LVNDYSSLRTFREIPFLQYTEIALLFPDGGAEKRVSERKLRLREAPEARKLAFSCRRSARALMDFLSAKIPPQRDQQLPGKSRGGVDFRAMGGKILDLPVAIG
jgi:hypothetical protein